MRYTTYHCGKAVIKDKNKLSEAMEKLAKLEDMEESGEWIPCSERLQEEGKIVIVDIGSDYGNRRYLFAYYTIDDYMDCWRNANTGFRIWRSVIAWMPLPDPYREATDEENLESRR